VRREDHRHAVGHLVQFLDEDRALGLQRVDHELVVDDLVPDIDRRAIFLDRQLDDADRAVDARAEAARGGDEEFEGRLLRLGPWRAPLRDCLRVRKAVPMVPPFPGRCAKSVSARFL
jgi:hypothetical protein